MSIGKRITLFKWTKHQIAIRNKYQEKSALGLFLKDQKLWKFSFPPNGQIQRLVDDYGIGKDTFKKNETY